MALKGDTTNLLLADIFQTLSQNGQLGLLTLRSGDVQHRILFAAQGITPYDARVYRAPRLAHLLVAGGVVAPDQVDACMAEVDEAGPDPFSSVPLLCLLDEKGFLGLSDGARVLRSEVREELFEIFTLPRMEFEFDDTAVPVEGIPQQCFFRTEEVILEAARRLDEWELIHRTIGDGAEFYVASETESESKVQQLLDGSHTVLDISERLLMPRFEVARSVSRLVEEGTIRPAGPDELIQCGRRLDPVRDRTRIARILQRARAYLRADDPRLDDIIDLLVRVQAHPAAISILLVRARKAIEQGNEETAYTVVLRARDLDPNHLGVLEILADLHASRGEKESEIKVLTSLAERYAAGGKFEAAVEYAARVARLYPDSPLLDRAFVTYCQKASQEKRGIDLLAQAAGMRTTPARAVVLYDAILQLDPSRSDVRKLKARHQRTRRHRRLIWSAAVALLVPGIALAIHVVLLRIEHERYRGRLDAAALLLQRGEPRLAEAQLQDLLAAGTDETVRLEAEALLASARNRVADLERTERTEREQSARDDLGRIQADLDGGRYAATLGALAAALAETGGDAEVRDSILGKGRLLARAVEEEHARLVRLAGRFREPEDDGLLVALQNEYAIPFAAARVTEFGALVLLLRTPPAGAERVCDLGALERLARESLATLERTRPGVESVAARIERNQALASLSHEYEEVRAAEESGDLEEAIRGYDRLLRGYGDGPLVSFFQERRARVTAARDAWREATRLVEQGNAADASRRMREADAAAGDLALGHTIGFPVLVTTIPAGAAVQVDGAPGGRTPWCCWVRQGTSPVVDLAMSGFRPVKLSLTSEAEPQQHVELAREARFEVRLGAAVDVRPLVAGGRAFIGARDGQLYRIDLKDGRRLGEGRTESLAGVAAPPLEHEDLVIAPLGEGALRAFDRTSLATRWTRAFDRELVGTPVLERGRVYVLLADGGVFEVDALRGSARRIVTVAGAVSAGPAVQDGVLGVGRADGSVVLVSRTDGQTIAVTPARPQPLVGLTVLGDGLLAADDGGNLIALARNGSVRWEWRAGGAAAAPPAAHDGFVVFAAGQRAYVLDGEDGTVRTEVEVREWIAGTPALAGGRLYVGDRSGTLNAFDASTGNLLFRHKVDGILRASPLVVPEGVLLVTDRGQVVLIGA